MGYLRYAEQIFSTAFAMQDAVKAHDELQLMGDPTWCFSFTSDVFDIYHVNDAMRPKGWRFNGQQYPNAIHMCVTRPQTQPGVVEEFTTDLAEAVAYALDPADPRAHVGRHLRRRPRWPDARGRGLRARDHDLDARRHAADPGSRRMIRRPARGLAPRSVRRPIHRAGRR